MPGDKSNLCYLTKVFQVLAQLTDPATLALWLRREAAGHDR